MLLEPRLPAVKAPDGPAISVSDATPDLIDQYQKQIRLQHARVRLLANPGDVAGAGHAVGYASASQFTREYRRLSGAPPGQDAARLQDARLVVE